MAAAEDFDTAMSAVATALGTNDFSEAKKQLRVAMAHAARLPVSAAAGSISAQQRALQDIAALEALISKAEARANKATVYSRWVL